MSRTAPGEVYVANVRVRAGNIEAWASMAAVHRKFQPVPRVPLEPRQEGCRRSPATDYLVEARATA